MLFNSHVFIFLFLPLVLGGYYGLRRLPVYDRLPLLWLLLMSVFFYGWWETRYLLLLAISSGLNFAVGRLIFRADRKRLWLVCGIAFNLILLAYFKYAGFIMENLDSLFGQNWTVGDITLPLAISFFTFQQIAWLVDISRSQAGVPTFYNYALFVSFFPQLIAGPIVHHAEMMPQFERRPDQQRLLSNINIGLTLFTLGLFKKVVLADQFALYSTPVFEAAARGELLTLLEAWSGTMSYTLQLYFDFSGYSDMAVGLARMLGIILPLNFFSPYKAVNIRQFWQRWHITLSRFLRDYLYIPLGGNRGSAAGVSFNILLTMLIGGLWHGAAWTFVAWGGLHGLYLLLHRFYEHCKGDGYIANAVGRFAGVLLTFVAVMLAWVLFRAESFAAAVLIYKSLFGFSGLAFPEGLFTGMPAVALMLREAGITVVNLTHLQGLPELAWLTAGCVICFFAPNAYEFLASQQPALIPAQLSLRQSRICWRDNAAWAVVFALLFSWSALAMNRLSEFLYFQF